MSQSAEPETAISSAIETDSHARHIGADGRWDDVRRYPRFPFQAQIEATILPLDVNQAAPVRCMMMTRDLSRGGINLIHSDQLFPGQRIEIALNGMQRCVEVMWCRRLANRCFSAGCRFVARKTEGGEKPDGKGDN
jgi:hypothetical protein